MCKNRSYQYRGLKKMGRFIIVIFLALGCPLAGFAGETADSSEETNENQAVQLEEMVVTANRIETPMADVTRSIGRINREQMDTAQESFLPEMMDTIPGVTLRRNGGIGQYTIISIRGASSEYTQFQYNGIPLRDAADSKSALHNFIKSMYSASNVFYIIV